MPDSRHGALISFPAGCRTSSGGQGCRRCAIVRQVNAFDTPLYQRHIALQHHPLGSTFTGSLHSVVSSLPTRRDVVGYEEKSPEVIGRLKQGYPRFLRHHLVVAVSNAIAARNGWGEAFVCPVASPEAARRLRDYAGKTIGVYEDEHLSAIAFKPRTLTADRARSFLQHTGAMISSRLAEDWLVANGVLDAAVPEQLASSDAERVIRGALRPWLATGSDALLTITCGGANAFWGAYESISELQAGRGRDIWLQLGWLYVDTGMVLERFARADGPEKWVTAHCLDEVETYLATHGARVAGIVCETPSNPLLETVDVQRLSELAQRHGAKLVLDPTVASLVNVDVLPYADAVVCSLTKYAARGADVLAGCVAINPDRADAADLAQRVRAIATPLYGRDAARLAHEIAGMPAFVARVNATAVALAEHLERHPRVAKVRHPLQTSECDCYRGIMRADAGPGALLSISVHGDMERFFDALSVAKAASFGAEFTIAAPFLYLAHYDLVSTPDGRAWLHSLGIDPDLVRVSVGAEPIEALISVFDDALAQL